MKYDLKKLNEKGIECGKININLSKSYIVLTDNISEDYYSDVGESFQHYLYEYHGSICGIAFDEDNEICLGYFNGICVNASDILNDTDIDFRDMCDAMDQTAYDFASVISDKNGCIDVEIVKDADKIILLDRIYIEENYRNCSLGRYVIDNLSKFFAHNLNFSFDAIILQPIPQERNQENLIPEYVGEGHEKRKNDLIKFYKSLGFRYIKNTSYMIKFER